VDEGPVLASDTKVAWIGFDDAGKDFDYIFIKFTKVMKSTGANGVARTTNYSLNNNPLPQGSEVIKGIKDWEGNANYGNVTNDWDGVTIKMPKTAWDGTPVASGTDFTMVVGVASNFEATDGENLDKPYTVQLNHQGDNSAADADFDFEALYLNAAASNLIAGGGVSGAEATDTNANGEIETISLYKLDGTAKIAGTSGHQIKVNGVVFTSDGNDYTTTTPLKTTDSSGFKITSMNGAIIVNTGNVIDLAKPVLIKAKGSDGSKEVILTFSEKVIGSVAPDNEFDETYFDFVDNTSGGTATQVDSVETHNTPLTTITVILDAKLDASNIGVSGINLTTAQLTSIEDLAETPNNAAANEVLIK